MTEPQARLNELDKDEMWDVTRRLKPSTTREEFDEMWDEFCALRDEHERKAGLQ